MAAADQTKNTIPMISTGSLRQPLGMYGSIQCTLRTITSTRGKVTLTNIVGLYGDMAGIIGGTLPEIAAIELKALAADTASKGDGTEGETSSGTPFASDA